MSHSIKHYKIPLISSALGISGVFLFSYLTFIPSQTFAESLIVDENEKRSLSQINTMQEMSQQICINSRKNETKQLTDTRDQKKYWVTKLKDSNCWMTQNLDYDLSTNKKITDLVDWENKNFGGKVDNDTEAYYDPGDYYYNGDRKAGCSSTTGFSDCVGTGVRQGFSITGDAHYHIGNYYSWNAATSGTGSTITSGEASSSICPTGWRLPTGGNNIGEFRKIMLAYGWTTDNPTNIAKNMNEGKGIQGDPLYFVYSGGLYNGQLYTAGYDGRYWSSTPTSNAAQAYDIIFYDDVYPSGYENRYVGNTIRCLAEGGSFPDPILDDSQALISATVSPVISIDATSNMNGEVDFTTIATGAISADISSNQAYQILLGTSQSTLEQTPVIESTNIPMLTSDQVITAGSSQWGIKKLVSSTDYTTSTITENDKTLTVIQSSTPEPTGNNLTTTVNTYSPIGLITLSDQNTIVDDKSETFFNNGTIGSTRILFPIAIAVNPSLPSGKYSTDVTITAVAN